MIKVILAFRHIEGCERAIIHAANSNLMPEMESTNLSDPENIGIDMI